MVITSMAIAVSHNQLGWIHGQALPGTWRNPHFEWLKHHLLAKKNTAFNEAQFLVFKPHCGFL